MSNHPKTNVNQARFQILVFTLTIAVFITTLFPRFARAGILDGLSNTVQQTMGQVTGTINNAINTPIQQVENVLGDVQDGVMQPINNVLGDLNRTLSSLLAPFQQQLQQYFQIFTQTFQQILKDVMGTIGDVFTGSDTPWNEQWGHNSDGADHTGESSSGGSLDQALEMPIVTGSLGLPDFIRNHQALYEQAIRNTRQGTPAQTMRSHDRFNINPLPLAQSMQFMQDRAQNNGMAATILSSEGQAALRQEMQGADTTLKQIQGLAQQAQGFDVTQNVMKNLTALQANQSALQAGSYAQLMALRAQEAANAVVTSNISESLDEGNRARHAESMATADSVLRSSASYYLPGLVR